MAATDAATVPRYTVDLDAPPEARWAEVIGIYAGQLRSVEAQIDTTIKEIAPTAGPILSGFVESVLSTSNKMNVVYYSAELKAIAKLAGMPLGKLVAMQLIYEACANCTSIAVPTGAKAGDAPRMKHIRTMDWEMDFLRPLTIEVAFVRGAMPVAVLTTWVGYVGALTGVALRPDPRYNFSVSVNFRAVGSGTFWTNLKKAVASAWPIGFLVREALETAGSYSEATQWLRKSELIAPCYVTVCGTGDNEGCLITRERSEDLQFWSVGSKGPVVQPNMDHWSTDPNDSIMLSIQRRECARKALTKLQREADDGGIATEALWKMMSKKPIFNEITVYGTYMCPAEGVLETRLPRPYYGFVKLTESALESISDNVTFATCNRCDQRFDEALNAPGQCAHKGTWHSRYEDCSYLKCGFGLGPSKVGKQHWGCCFSTDPNAPCKKSPVHERA